jgi:hypothetical protein
VSIVCSSRPGSMCECGIATEAMPSLRLLVEYSPASLKVDSTGSRDALCGVGVEERNRGSRGADVVRRTLPWSQ